MFDSFDSVCVFVLVHGGECQSDCRWGRAGAAGVYRCHSWNERSDFREHQTCEYTLTDSWRNAWRCFVNEIKPHVNQIAMCICVSCAVFLFIWHVCVCFRLSTWLRRKAVWLMTSGRSIWKPGSVLTAGNSMAHICHWYSSCLWFQQIKCLYWMSVLKSVALKSCSSQSLIIPHCNVTHDNGEVYTYI